MSLKIVSTRIRRGRFPRLIGVFAAAGIGLGLVLIGAVPANAATTDWAVASTIIVGTGPGGVAVSPDGTHLYVANNGGTTVSVIDTATNTVTATVSVGNAPSDVAVAARGSIQRDLTIEGAP